MPIHVAVAAVAVATSAPLLWWAISGGRQPAAHLVARNLALGRAALTDLRETVLQQSARKRAVQPAVAALARRARRVTPEGLLAGLERRLVLAGLPSWGIERVLAAKFGLGLVAGLFGLTVFLGSPSTGTLLVLAVAGAAGFFGPDAVLNRRARERQATIERELPDTLDQITITVEAGLGFEAAMARVGQSGRGPLARELARMLQDIQLGMRRRDALNKLLERTDVADLRRFVHAVVQAESYGVPIAQVLRVQAAELREKRRHRAEERAMKIPVKVVLPLILCILPTLFVVILGPAVIQLVRDWPT